jgi:flagellar biosynthesis/type III secretory pathway M-ring protein FliF/YscJ
MGWLLRKLAGKQMPKEGVVTSCDIRAKRLTQAVLIAIVGLCLVAIAFLVVYFAYTSYMTLVFDKGGSRGLLIAVITAFVLIITFRNA